MLWLLYIPLQLALLAAGIRDARRAGTWRWTLFFFALGFAALETLLITVPVVELGVRGNRYFVPVWTAAWVLAAFNFVWFLRVCRRWNFNKPPA